MPGGKAVLYTSSSVAGAYGDADIVVQALPNGPRKVVQRGGYHGRYLPSGHLIYIHHGTLFAAPFDLGRLEVTSQPVPVIEGMNANSLTGGAQFAVPPAARFCISRDTKPAPPIRSSGWIMTGRPTPLRATPANWFTPRFSPDGSQLAMEIRDGTLSDIYVYECGDGQAHARDDPSSHRPAAGVDAGCPVDRVCIAARGQIDPEPVVAARRWHGRRAAAHRKHEHSKPILVASERQVPRLRRNDCEDRVDIMILPLEGDDASGWTPGKPRPFLHDTWAEFEPMFSPDGRWLAYTSFESGRPEVYVRPFPGPGGKWLIGAGSNPTWSRNMRELFYGASGQINVASFTVNGTLFRPGEPRRWSEGRYQVRGTLRMFDLHPDGERFALALPRRQPAVRRRTRSYSIFNFFDELRRVVSPTKR